MSGGAGSAGAGSGGTSGGTADSDNGDSTAGTGGNAASGSGGDDNSGTPPPSPFTITNTWPGKTDSTGAFLVVGNGLETVDGATIGGVAAEILGAPHHDYIWIGVPSSIASGPAALSLSAAGVATQLSVEIAAASDLPSTPLTPPGYISPVDLRGFDGGSISDDWINDYDANDFRYFFDLLGNDGALWSFTGHGDRVADISGTYDEQSALVRFSIRDSEESDPVFYDGVLSGDFTLGASPTGSNCPRMILVPEGTGRQIVLHPYSRSCEPDADPTDPASGGL